MSATSPPKIIAVGCVDERGINSTSGLSKSWEELAVAAPGNGRTYRELSGKSDPTFRRLDRQTRAIVLAAQACGINDLLSAEEREETALVTETTCGAIEVDLRYTRALDMGIVHAAIFPYTLQSTCLGDVALRHGLRGPTVCLSLEPGQEGEALREARRLLVPGGPPFAVVGTVDSLDETLPLAEPALRSVMCVLAAADTPRPSVVAWPESGDPFSTLAEVCF